MVSLPRVSPHGTAMFCGPYADLAALGKGPWDAWLRTVVVLGPPAGRVQPGRWQMARRRRNARLGPQSTNARNVAQPDKRALGVPRHSQAEGQLGQRRNSRAGRMSGYGAPSWPCLHVQEPLWVRPAARFVHRSTLMRSVTSEGGRGSLAVRPGGTDESSVSLPGEPHDSCVCCRVGCASPKVALWINGDRSRCWPPACWRL
jgi:hypothetical protein